MILHKKSSVLDKILHLQVNRWHSDDIQLFKMIIICNSRILLVANEFYLPQMNNNFLQLKFILKMYFLGEENNLLNQQIFICCKLISFSEVRFQNFWSYWEIISFKFALPSDFRFLIHHLFFWTIFLVNDFPPKTYSVNIFLVIDFLSVGTTFRVSIKLSIAVAKQIQVLCNCCYWHNSIMKTCRKHLESLEKLFSSKQRARIVANMNKLHNNRKSFSQENSFLMVFVCRCRYQNFIRW